MSNIFKYALLTLLAAFIFSCKSNHTEEISAQIEEKNEPMMVTFEVVETRGAYDENTVEVDDVIKDIVLLSFFHNDPTVSGEQYGSGTLKEIIEVEDFILSINDVTKQTEARFEFGAKLTDIQTVYHFLVNTGLKKGDLTGYVGKSESEVMKLLTQSSTALFSSSSLALTGAADQPQSFGRTAIYSSAYTKLPMWGEIVLDKVDFDGAIVAGESTYKRDLEGTLLRSVSRVDIIIGNDLVAGTGTAVDKTGAVVETNVKFELYGASVWHTPTKGYLAPHKETLTTGVNIGNVTEPSVPSDFLGLIGESNVPKYESFTATPAGANIINRIFMYENETPASIDYDKNIRERFVIIWGAYSVDGGAPEMKYYRLLMRDENDVNQTIDMLRNHLYILQIDNLSSEGFSTEEEAADGEPIFVQVNITPWTEINISDSLDENIYLDISHNQLKIGNRSVLVSYDTNMTANTPSTEYIEIYDKYGKEGNGGVVTKYAADSDEFSKFTLNYFNNTIHIDSSLPVGEYVMYLYVGKSTDADDATSAPTRMYRKVTIESFDFNVPEANNNAQPEGVDTPDDVYEFIRGNAKDLNDYSNVSFDYVLDDASTRNDSSTSNDNTPTIKMVSKTDPLVEYTLDSYYGSSIYNKYFRITKSATGGTITMTSTAYKNLNFDNYYIMVSLGDFSYVLDFQLFGFQTDDSDRYVNVTPQDIKTTFGYGTNIPYADLIIELTRDDNPTTNLTNLIDFSKYKEVVLNTDLYGTTPSALNFSSGQYTLSYYVNDTSGKRLLSDTKLTLLKFNYLVSGGFFRQNIKINGDTQEDRVLLDYVPASGQLTAITEDETVGDLGSALFVPYVNEDLGKNATIDFWFDEDLYGINEVEVAITDIYGRLIEGDELSDIGFSFSTISDGGVSKRRITVVPREAGEIGGDYIVRMTYGTDLFREVYVGRQYSCVDFNTFWPDSTNPSNKEFEVTILNYRELKIYKNPMNFLQLFAYNDSDNTVYPAAYSYNVSNDNVDKYEPNYTYKALLSLPYDEFVLKNWDHISSTGYEYLPLQTKEFNLVDWDVFGLRDTKITVHNYGFDFTNAKTYEGETYDETTTFTSAFNKTVGNITAAQPKESTATRIILKTDLFKDEKITSIFFPTLAKHSTDPAVGVVIDNATQTDYFVITRADIVLGADKYYEFQIEVNLDSTIGYHNIQPFVTMQTRIYSTNNGTDGDFKRDASGKYTYEYTEKIEEYEVVPMMINVTAAPADPVEPEEPVVP